MIREIKNVSIIGMGAMGCAYSSQIFKNIQDINVKIIAEGKRAERYRKDGFVINGEKYFYDVAEPDEKCEAADLIIVAVKYNQLKEAVTQIKNHVGDNTIIISLLNGITSEEILGEVYGKDKMLYSISAGIDAVREGHQNVKFKNIGYIDFGEESNDILTDKVKTLKEFFNKAKIENKIPKDMIRSLWWKFMVNVGINQTSAVLKANYGVFQREQAAINIMRNAMEEVILVSQKAGVNLTEEDIEDWVKVLNKLSPEGKTSMCQDIMAKRKTEIEIFGGTVVELGKKYNVLTPINSTLTDIIKVTESLY
ncbi:ketopantoate reductase family protein [Clostridium ljungdahlii]|uniref:2-dehydropantoate 2-reductase n=1 Tax=Clostridium ljungdahlii (strain ATCC 55383 / DSM 13528 / PETC) TaxID=748727 RepID=D8GPN1_CLOLD|nr:2-dehydropantoate 2-reductase [Clostridium ljungdahlii DSM 13528]OAA87431.1 2-dehydropantoate 2-reductase [Clostridium ljungdahlii DSM 13528]